MKQFSLIIIFSCFGLVLLGQAQPGLHVDEEHTVLFGKDTTSAGIKFLWYPSKAALRAGKTNGLNNMTSWDQSIVGPFTAAFGVDTEARGNYSFAAGLATFANSYAESSFGRYSLGGGDVTAWNPIDPLFEVGNGIGNNARANALTIYKNGNAEFQRSIKLGDHTGTVLSNGTIRYNGSDFQGRIGGVWQSLTSGSGGGGVTPWSTVASNIYYNTGNIGIGTSNPIDNISLFGNNGNSQTIGISIRNGQTTIPLSGGPPTGPSSTGRIWQDLNKLNMGLAEGTSKISFDDSTVWLNSPNFNTDWGFIFQHFDARFSSANRSQTWLKKSWRGDLGDYLYLGSTGNRAITNQSAMVLTQSQGIQFGKGNTNDADGLGPNRIELDFGVFSNSIESTNDLQIKALNNRNLTFSANLISMSDRVKIGGTFLPAGYSLSVNGKIAAEEVLVQLSGNWPDYVFKESYDLMPLDRLESYIHDNNHLPGVPAAGVIEAEGIEVGEMHKMQMEKIEELTLYIIELQKEIKALKIKVDSL